MNTVAKKKCVLVKNPVQWCSAIQNGGGLGKGGGGFDLARTAALPVILQNDTKTVLRKKSVQYI